MASTVDVPSRGRLSFGIGAGGFEHEYGAYGYERLIELEEAGVQELILRFSDALNLDMLRFFAKEVMAWPTRYGRERSWIQEDAQTWRPGQTGG
jgi:hypothetical protein